MPDDFDPGIIIKRFYAEYAARYGTSYDDLAFQIVTLRVIATAMQDRAAIALPFPSGDTDPAAALKGERLAFAPDLREMVSHQVYDMDRLRPNTKSAGPAIIEEESSTLIVARGGRVTVDGRGWIVVELQEASLETAT